MTETKLFSDPNNEPVVFANRVLVVGNSAHVFNITLGVARFSPGADPAQVDDDIIVAARLRLDLPTAMALATALKDQIDKLTGAKDAKH